MINYRNFVFFFILLTLVSCIKNAEKQLVESEEKYLISKSAIAEKAMVVTAHPTGTEVGLSILKAGGNAVDAAIAVQFALAVTFPNAGNIGGGGFMVLRTDDGEMAALDFREKAPSLATETMYQDEKGEVIKLLSRKGHLSVGVPGSVAGMFAAHKKYGKLPMQQLIEPAIKLAKDGFVLTARQAEELNNQQENFKEYNTVLPVFVRQETWKEGETIVQSDLAHTLELIRDNGQAGFYTGETATKIVEEMQRGNGLITLEDLEKYEAVWRKPITSDYRGYTIIGMSPPSSGGIALAQLLELVEPFPLGEYGFHSSEAVHLMVEAERRVYADRATYLGDSDFYPVPKESLLDSLYLMDRMSNFDPQKITPSDKVSAGSIQVLAESEETTHFSIVDEEGNAVSVTTTINGGYGAFTVVGNAGFFLNNEMDDFSAKPGVPNLYGLLGAEANKIEPGKRMLSAMTPTIVLKDDQLKMVVGTPGGSTIITSVFQCVVNVLDFGMTMTEAVHANRFHHQWKPPFLFVESDSLPATTLEELRAKGHQIKARGSIGRVEAILVREDGKLEGAADRRRDDHAAGY